MDKNKLVVVGLLILLLAGVAFLGRQSGAPVDGRARITAALLARKVVVVAVTDGSDRQYLEGLKRVVSQAPAGRVALVHIDKRNPVEKDAMAGFAGRKLPLAAVLGLDAKPAYESEGQYDPSQVAKAIQDGLTKPPVQPPSGEHEH